jgi:NAD(P)-dependent dehydrogenase (short-subunit alcohol dehydrogenase family)
MTTPPSRRLLVTGAHRPLGMALARRALERGDHVAVTVPNPARVPAIADLRDEHPTRLHVVAWDALDAAAIPRAAAAVRAALGPVDRAIVCELPLPPANDDLADDLRPAMLALTVQPLANTTASLLATTLHATQLATTLLDGAAGARLLIVASWLGSVTDKIRGGEHLAAVPHAAQLMLARTLQHDLLSGGVPTVVANAGRYRIDPAGLAFQPDADEVAGGLLDRLEDDPAPGGEPAFLDWRRAPRHW